MSLWIFDESGRICGTERDEEGDVGIIILVRERIDLIHWRHNNETLD
jgi:hypothetical protein